MLFSFLAHIISKLSGFGLSKYLYKCFKYFSCSSWFIKSNKFTEATISTYDVIERASKNDEKAILSLKTWQNDIALGILGLNNIFDADCFVLSGSMEKFVNVNEIEKFVNSKTVTTPTKIHHAKAGNHAGMIGAVLLANELI